MANLPLDRLVRLSQIERVHFWFIGRRQLIDRALRKYFADKVRVILEVGCGTGLMVENLTLQGRNLIGLDRRPEGLRTIHEKLPRTPLLQGDAESLPMKLNSCDAVMMLDVLEHVNDRAALAEAYRVVTSGGLVLIMVPALPWLWSYRDHSAGHLRRYGRRALARLLTDSRFTILHMTSYQFFLSPLLMITRLLGRHGPALRDFEESPGAFTNAILKWVTQMELKLGSFMAWPWGSSLLAVCRKR